VSSLRSPIAPLTLVAALLPFTVAEAATLSVCAAGCDHPDIVSAVAAAADNDEIVVEPGTYTGRVLIDFPLTLRSTGGSAVTLIAGGSGNSTVDIDDAEVLIEGFEILPASARALEVRSDARVVARDILVQNASGGHGVGADANGGELIVEDSVFRNLSSTSDGACLYAHSGGSLTVSGVLCEGASGTKGGGVALNSASSGSFSNLVVTGAAASERGGSLFANNIDSLAISDSSFIDGTAADRGGHLYLTSVDLLTVADTRFEGGQAVDGGAAYLVSNIPIGSFERVDFSANIATAAGGAVYTAAEIELVDSAFQQNSAILSGGAVYSSGTLSASRVVFDGNSAGSGGAVGVDGGVLIATDVRFIDNDAAAGGAVDVASGAADLQSTYLCGNTGVRGAGLFVQLGSTAAISGSVAADNHATATGGAAEVQGVLTILQADLLGNSAPAGGGLVNDGVLDIQHSLLLGNDSYGIESAGGITSNWNAWWQNTPGDVGGGLVDGDRGPDLVDADPLLDFSPNGDCFDDQFSPPVGSALIDAGDPGLTDSDGSRRDIGAFGGDVPASDGDGDGVPFAWDCDDGEATVAPALPEVCSDGLDNDCNGLVDDCLPTTWWLDGDGDGYGDPGTSVESGSAPSGYVANGEDCDDLDEAVNPAAMEVCNGVDDDCNGADDDGLPLSSYYLDGDGDGYGTGAPIDACGPLDGYSTVDGDCDDGDPERYPGAGCIVDTGQGDTGQVDTGGQGPDPEVVIELSYGVGGRAPRGCGCAEAGAEPLLGRVPLFWFGAIRRR